MVDRIEVIASNIDPRGEAMRRRLAAHGFSGIRDIKVVDNYMLAQTLKAEQLAAVARMLTNPVIERSSINQALHPELFDWAIEVGYLPGVKDNIASTTQEGIEALLDQRFDDQVVASSQTLFLAGDMTETEVRAVADGQYNPLIQHAAVKSRDQFLREGGMGAAFPHVRLGAKPVSGGYGFCFGMPDDDRPLYKGKNFTQRMLSPRRIMDGVIRGVNVGGNCSGIPTPQGILHFHERYRGKPLVFVRVEGIIPVESAERPSHEKQARPGDYIVMVGGRVGMDGIHGATFSSEAMDAGSTAPRSLATCTGTRRTCSRR